MSQTGMGPGAGSRVGANVPGLLNANASNSGIDNLKGHGAQLILPPGFKNIGGMQGFMGSVDLGTVSMANMLSPPSTPFAGKIPGVFSAKGK